MTSKRNRSSKPKNLIKFSNNKIITKLFFNIRFDVKNNINVVIPISRRVFDARRRWLVRFRAVMVVIWQSRRSTRSHDSDERKILKIQDKRIITRTIRSCNDPMVRNLYKQFILVIASCSFGLITKNIF